MGSAKPLNPKRGAVTLSITDPSDPLQADLLELRLCIDESATYAITHFSQEDNLMTSITDTQSTQSTLVDKDAPFKFPQYYSFPPFFTLQPTLLTRTAQLRKWSLLIQSYCRHNRVYRLSLIDAVNSPLFHNAQISKRLSLMDARTVLDWMGSEEGDRRAEWVGRKEDKVAAWVWWRRPEEWAEVLAGWVEETGQKGTVLTLYEIVNGLPSADQEFHAMDQEVLQRSLGVLVKRGKAQVFGSEDEQGVKFF